MKLARMATVLAFALTVSAAASPAGVALAQDYTCHERCRIKCIQLYPGNPAMQNLCTWSCIDQKCGGGPFP